MERHLKILEFALSSLLRRKNKNISIVALFSFLIAVLSSILFLTYSLRTEAEKVLLDAPDMVVQKLSGGRHDLIPAKYMENIRTIFGVGGVTPRYWGYYYDQAAGCNYTLMGVDANKNTFKMLAGKMPMRQGECAIGKGVAEVKRLRLHDKIYLIDSRGRGRDFQVVGIFSAASQILTNDLFLLQREDVIDFFQMPPGEATDIVVEVNNTYEVPYVVGKIREMMPDTRPIMKAEIIRTYETIFSWRSGMTLAMFSGALLAFCILAWDKATGLNAEEKQEIGVLKAIGWETSDILELKFWEGVVISLTSFLTGILLGYAHVFFGGGSIFSPMLRGWSVLFPQFTLLPYIDVYQVMTLLFLTVAPYIACTIIPSWKTAITDPVNAMRE